MDEVEQILLDYHANHMSKQQAYAAINDLIDAERITLRDEFAGQTLCDVSGVGSPENIAKWAYEIADAMLLERAK